MAEPTPSRQPHTPSRRGRGRGRVTKLTPALQQAIVNAVAGGVPFMTACHLAGITHEIGYEWIRRGEDTHATRPSAPIYVQFAQAITHARAQDETRRLLQISQAGKGGAVVHQRTVEKLNAAGEVISRTTEVQHAPPDWRADAFVLERSRPDSWGRRDRVDIHVVEKVAQEVGDKYGMTAAEVLAEAQTFLKEHAYAARSDA